MSGWRWAGLGVALAALAGYVVATDPRGAVVPALIAAVGAGLWLASRPRAAFAVWLAVLCAVPVWAIEPNIVVAMPPATLAFLVIIPALLRTRVSMRAADWWLLGFLGACAVAAVVFDAPQYAMAGLVAQSGTAYLVGRRLAPACGEQWAYRAVAIACAAVAAWACLEFVTGLHVFEDFVGSGSQSFWREIQVRGGSARSEAAFGHAIALGGFVAIGVPFALAAGFRTGTQLLLIGLLSAGLLVSLSRGPILGGLLALVLALLFLPASQMARNTRLVLFGVGLFAVFVVAPRLLDFFAAAGEDTAASADYRARLITHWSDDLRLFGQADYVTVGVDGVARYRGFASIDNGWLHLGLQFGWVPLVVLVLASAAVVWRVLVRHAGPAEVALLGQVLILATVAQITQHGTAVWLVAGLAVAFARRAADPAPPSVPRPAVSGPPAPARVRR